MTRAQFGISKQGFSRHSSTWPQIHKLIQHLIKTSNKIFTKTDKLNFSTVAANKSKPTESFLRTRHNYEKSITD